MRFWKTCLNFLGMSCLKCNKWIILWCADRRIKLKKYKVVDLGEGKETIGYADTIDEIKRLAKQWIDNVTEEAAVFYYPLNEETGKYKFSERKFLETY